MVQPPTKTQLKTATIPSPPPEQPPIREAIDDGIVTAKLRARLKDDPVTKAYMIQVETFHGTVILSGYVEYMTVRAHVVQIATELAGANRVKDAMEIHDL